jgi:type IV pilus assembly protein PilB
MSTKRLGELLVREKLISLQQLRSAQEEQKKSGQNLSYTLAKLGFISDGEITSFLSSQYRLPSINLDEYEIEPDVIKLVSREVCEKHKIIPVSRSGSALIVAMADPTNLNATDDVKFLTGFNVEPVVCSEGAIATAIERYYSSGPSYEEVMADFGVGDEDIDFTGDDEEVNVLELEKASEDAPVVRLVNVILLNAIRKGASDIHIEPYEKKMRVRYRIDGVLHEEMTPPLKLKNAISSRLKIMSMLDIAERRLPQDGRIKLKLGKDREMDFRVSVLPTMWGEKIVLRLLDKSNLQLDMTKLGFDKAPLDDFKWAISQPWGMVLVTGPTGSGKTTTLYSALSDLNQPDVNISTAEDPVEYNLHGINQVQMHDEIGLNFAMSLRSFLRQDPDVIMVGEIRDFETAEIAVKAALTGHLVLSTLHTNDAPAQHGCRAVPHHGEREPRSGATPRAEDLCRLQAAVRARERGAEGDRFRRHAGRIHDLQGRRLQYVQRLRLQGARRALRSDALRRQPEGNGAAGSFGGGTEGRCHPRRHEHPPCERDPQGHRGRHDHGRDHARHDVGLKKLEKRSKWNKRD